MVKFGTAIAAILMIAAPFAHGGEGQGSAPAELYNPETHFQAYNGTKALGGVCCMRFGVNENGSPVKITAENCPDQQMAGAAKRMVSRWVYKPAAKDGTPIFSSGHRAVVKFYPLRSDDGSSLRIWQRSAGGTAEYEDLCHFRS